MKVYDQIKDMLCDELEGIAKKKELTTNSLEVLYKGIDIIKDISTIEAMEQEYGHDEGYSECHIICMMMEWVDMAILMQEVVVQMQDVTLWEDIPVKEDHTDIMMTIPEIPKRSCRDL